MLAPFGFNPPFLAILAGRKKRKSRAPSPLLLHAQKDRAAAPFEAEVPVESAERGKSRKDQHSLFLFSVVSPTPAILGFLF